MSNINVRSGLRVPHNSSANDERQSDTRALPYMAGQSKEIANTILKGEESFIISKELNIK